MGEPKASHHSLKPLFRDRTGQIALVVQHRDWHAIQARLVVRIEKALVSGQTVFFSHVQGTPVFSARYRFAASSCDSGFRWSLPV